MASNRPDRKNIIHPNEVQDLLNAIEQASIPLMPELCANKTTINDRYEKIGITELCSFKRRQELIYARMVFAYYCRKQYTEQAIATFIDRKTHCVVVNYLKNYQNDILYRHEFRKFAQLVERILNKKSFDQITNNNQSCKNDPGKL